MFNINNNQLEKKRKNIVESKYDKAKKENVDSHSNSDSDVDSETPHEYDL